LPHLGQVYIVTRDLFLEKLPLLLEGYKVHDINSINDMGLLYSCFPDRMLTLKAKSIHRVKSVKERKTLLLCVNSDDSDKQLAIVVENHQNHDVLTIYKNFL
jgi:hypothetical protein